MGKKCLSFQKYEQDIPSGQGRSRQRLQGIAFQSYSAVEEEGMES